jgi:hypothetical protein
VSEEKSDRESDGDPICMQIGRRIGCKNVRVDGPLGITVGSPGQSTCTHTHTHPGMCNQHEREQKEERERRESGGE